MSTQYKTDNLGNKIVASNDGKTILLSLKLASENRMRNIGKVDISSRELTVRKKRAKHLFKKFNAYGFNHKLLDEAKTFDNIRLMDEDNEWIIPRCFILENGRYLNFVKSGGYELQIFIPLSEIAQFTVAPIC